MEELAVKLPFLSTHLRINYREGNRNDPGSHGVYTQLGSQTLHKYMKICVQFVIIQRCKKKKKSQVRKTWKTSFRLEAGDQRILPNPHKKLFCFLGCKVLNPPRLRRVQPPRRWDLGAPPSSHGLVQLCPALEVTAYFILHYCGVRKVSVTRTYRFFPSVFLASFCRLLCSAATVSCLVNFYHRSLILNFLSASVRQG